MSQLSEDPAERARRYISNFKTALARTTFSAEGSTIRTTDVREVTDAIQRYLKDAQYHLEDSKPTTALASIAYAEGLLDALMLLSLAKPNSTGQPL